MTRCLYEIVFEYKDYIKTFPTNDLNRALVEYGKTIISDEPFDKVALILPDRALITERYKVVDEEE